MSLYESRNLYGKIQKGPNLASEHIERMELKKVLQNPYEAQLYDRCMASPLLLTWTKLLVTYEQATGGLGYTALDFLTMPLEQIDQFVRTHWGRNTDELRRQIDVEWQFRMRLRDEQVRQYQIDWVEKHCVFQLARIHTEEGVERIFIHMLKRGCDEGEVFYEWVGACTFFRQPGAEVFSYRHSANHKENIGIARILREADAPDANTEKLLTWAQTLPPYIP